MIKNPNDIVDELITDLTSAFGNRLSSVVLFGNAVSHEFQPGQSLIETLAILDTTSFRILATGATVHKKWMKKGVVPPRYFTPLQLERTASVLPVRILDMQSTYRVLFGGDPFRSIILCKQNILSQCCSEFEDILWSVIDEFNRFQENRSYRSHYSETVIVRLKPFFKAILMLFDKRIPNATSEMIGAVEDLFTSGSSILSEIYLSSGNKKTITDDTFERFHDIINTILGHLYRLRIEPDGKDIFRIEQQESGNYGNKR